MHHAYVSGPTGLDSPFADRDRAIQRFVELGVQPASRLVDCAELVCAKLMLEPRLSYQAARQAIDALRNSDPALNDDLKAGGMTSDGVVSALVERAGLAVVDDGNLKVASVDPAAWLGGRGLARFGTLLSVRQHIEMSLQGAFAAIAWRHEHRYARTAFARQLCADGRLGVLRRIAGWLERHVDDGLDDVPRSLYAALWQLTAELFNARSTACAAEVSITPLMLRFSHVHDGQFVPLIGLPPDWVGLLSQELQRSYERRLEGLTGSDDPTLRQLGWLGLRSHGLLHPCTRNQLADWLEQDADADAACAVLMAQLEVNGDFSVTTALARDLGADTPGGARRRRVLAARIDQAEVQQELLRVLRVGVSGREHQQAAYELLRAATLTDPSLRTLVEVVAGHQFSGRDLAARLLVAQAALDDELVGGLEAEVTGFRALLPISRPAVDVIKHFRGLQLQPLLSYAHGSTYGIDGVVTRSAKDDHDGAQARRLVELIAAEDPEADTAARVLKTYPFVTLPARPLRDLLRCGTPRQQRLALDVLARDVCQRNAPCWEAAKVNAPAVAGLLAVRGPETLFIGDTADVAGTVDRLLIDGYCADDLLFKADIGDGKHLSMARRDRLTLDNALRPEPQGAHAHATTENDTTPRPSVQSADDQLSRDAVAAIAASSQRPAPNPAEQYTIMKEIVADIARFRDNVGSEPLDPRVIARKLNRFHRFVINEKAGTSVFALLYYLAFSYRRCLYQPRYTHVAKFTANPANATELEEIRECFADGPFASEAAEERTWLANSLGTAITRAKKHIPKNLRLRVAAELLSQKSPRGTDRSE